MSKKIKHERSTAMKTIILFLSLITDFSFVNTSEPIINISHSEATSFLHFLASGFGDSFTSGSMKQLTKSKKIKGFKNKAQNDDCNNVSSYLRNGYNFKSVAIRPVGLYGRDAFVGVSVTNPKLDGFEKNLSLFMSYDGIQSYFSLKSKFYSQFKKYVWNPTLSFQKKIWYCRAIKSRNQIFVTGTAPICEDGRIFEPGNPSLKRKSVLRSLRSR